jgi:hypothetical protein
MMDISADEKENKMDASNLSIIFAPSFLRNPTSDPMVQLKNIKAESKFIEFLMKVVDVSDVDTNPPLILPTGNSVSDPGTSPGRPVTSPEPLSRTPAHANLSRASSKGSVFQTRISSSIDNDEAKHHAEPLTENLIANSGARTPCANAVQSPDNKESESSVVSGRATPLSTQSTPSNSKRIYALPLSPRQHRKNASWKDVHQFSETTISSSPSPKSDEEEEIVYWGKA